MIAVEEYERVTGERDAARRELADLHDAIGVACNEHRGQRQQIEELERAVLVAAGYCGQVVIELHWLRLSHLTLALELVEAERERDAYANAAAAPGTY